MNDNKSPTAAQPLDLDKLEALARAATPGPWEPGSATLTTHRGCEGSWWEMHSIMMAPEGKTAHWQAGFVRDESNAAFIAAANPATILALIAQARAYQPEGATGTTGAVELSDAGIVEVLASMGVDSEPSKYGFKELQVRTTVPTIRKVVERYLAAPASAQPDRGAAQIDPVQIVREAVRQLAESPQRKDSSYVEGMVVGANMCLVRLERVMGETSPASQPVAPETAQGDAEFLSVRLARVARAAGVTMPEGSHDFIAGVAGTILGDIARKLESAPSDVNGATACQWPTCLSEVEQDNLADEVMRSLAGEPAVASSDAKDAAPTTVPDHSEREAANAGGLPVDLIHDFRDAINIAHHRADHAGDTTRMKRWKEVSRRLEAYVRTINAPATIAAGQEAANAKDAARVTYTCKGKGGAYSLIGVAYGAGTSRDTTVNLYREVGTGVMYFRTPADFHDRMERINAAMAAVGEAGQDAEPRWHSCTHRSGGRITRSVRRVCRYPCHRPAQTGESVMDRPAYKSETFYSVVIGSESFQGWKNVYAGDGALVFQNKAGDQVKFEGGAGQGWIERAWNQFTEMVSKPGTPSSTNQGVEK